jgi:antitoxin (DNA-binding transcriptional repressor) of toxin-antitoxin stability system
MATIRIAAIDGARDFAGLIAQVRAGAEVVVEDGSYPPALLHAALPVPRTISGSIEIARKLKLETGESPVLDPDFAEDVAEVIRNRRPWNPPAWD